RAPARRSGRPRRRPSPPSILLRRDPYSSSSRAPHWFGRLSTRTHSGNKKPAHRITSAAGKCLIKMDLPLAASEPSPPDRSRLGLRRDRKSRDNLPWNHFLAPPLPGPTGARFEFAAHTHGDEICSVTVAALQSLLH